MTFLVFDGKIGKEIMYCVKIVKSCKITKRLHCVKLGGTIMVRTDKTLAISVSHVLLRCECWRE